MHKVIYHLVVKGHELVQQLLHSSISKYDTSLCSYYCLQSNGSSYIVTFTDVVLMAWTTLEEDSSTENTSTSSTTLSFRMLMEMQRGAVPMVSPGRNVREVLSDK